MNQLKTPWTEQVEAHPGEVWVEYPRPAMVRESYVNLNGMWEYAITETKERPKQFDGSILVPFSPEAPLSGVNRQLQPGEYLWYRRTLPLLPIESGKRWLLQFGAVDQFAAVFVNGKLVCKHLGGYLPFTADVTNALKSGKNELLVVVRDSTEQSYYGRGKQKLKRGGMFYTAQSGIWQTVWMEQVPKEYIQGLKITPDYDDESVTVVVKAKENWKVRVSIRSKEMNPIQRSGVANRAITIPVKEMHSWSPEDPFLYDMQVFLEDDCVSSYFAMRKISMGKDEQGIVRPFLNNKPYFQNGVLDQGYWPDGLYTAPCDEALIFDIQEMKRLGFNMLRKHIKVEPQRWYYHCDRLGMLVWQDMVCGGRPYKHWYVTYLATVFHRMNIRVRDRAYHLLGRKDEEGKHHFIREMKDTIDSLYNHPSIVTWVIFNEGWGQFDAEKVTEVARRADASRLLDQASGWFDQKGGDYRSLHEYFFKLKFKPEDRIIALTEYGGLPWHVDEHSMYDKVYGYGMCRSREELVRKYTGLIDREIRPNIEKGVSVLTYTQLSDVEEEVNGIYTYDRKVLKFPEGSLPKLDFNI